MMMEDLLVVERMTLMLKVCVMLIVEIEWFVLMMLAVIVTALNGIVMATVVLEKE